MICRISKEEESMYWFTVTMLGMAHYFFHKGRTSGTWSKQKEPGGDPASLQKETDPKVPDHEQEADNDSPPDVEKSLETVSDPWERHLLYLQKIADAYRDRRTNMDDRSTAIALSRQYLSEFPGLRQGVFDNRKNQDPVISPVFKMLAIMLEEDGAYDQAVEVCRTALANGLEDGTKSGFEGRIQRLLKKKASPE
jgi:hypothetical protein